MDYLSVKNWSEFQQYKDRDPKWIKFHRDILYDYEIGQLDELAQLHLMKIWLLAAKTGNKVPNDPDWVARQIGAKSKVDLNQLCTNGFLVPYRNVQDCTETYLEAEAEEETEREEERAEAKPRKPKKTGSRLPAGWKPSTKLLTWALNERTDLDMQKVIDNFTDYWIAKTGAQATKLDWDATFRNWVRNEKSNRSAQTGNGQRETAVQRREREHREALERLT